MTANPVPETQLERLRAGDQLAWSELHQEHYGRMWSSIQRIIDNPSLTEDVVQEAFIKAHREIARFNAQAQIGTWLYRIGINQALDTLRKKQRLERWLSFFSPVIEDEDAPHPLPEGKVEARASLNLERADLRRELQAAMSELSAEHRAVIQLRLIDEFSLQETAAMLRCKPGTINSRLHYACQSLRQKLEKARST